MINPTFLDFDNIYCNEVDQLGEVKVKPIQTSVKLEKKVLIFSQ